MSEGSSHPPSSHVSVPLGSRSEGYKLLSYHKRKGSPLEQGVVLTKLLYEKLKADEILLLESGATNVHEWLFPGVRIEARAM